MTMIADPAHHLTPGARAVWHFRPRASMPATPIIVRIVGRTPSGKFKIVFERGGERYERLARSCNLTPA